jgi:hypothetical protein
VVHMTGLLYINEKACLEAFGRFLNSPPIACGFQSAIECKGTIWKGTEEYGISWKLGEVFISVHPK